jgi:DNA replication protein DnaD
MVILAIDETLRQGKRNWAYIRGILNRWRSGGILTPELVTAERAGFEATKARAAPPRSSPVKSNRADSPFTDPYLQELEARRQKLQAEKGNPQ